MEEITTVAGSLLDEAIGLITSPTPLQSQEDTYAALQEIIKRYAYEETSSIEYVIPHTPIETISPGQQYLLNTLTRLKIKLQQTYKANQYSDPPFSRSLSRLINLLEDFLEKKCDIEELKQYCQERRDIYGQEALKAILNYEKKLPKKQVPLMPLASSALIIESESKPIQEQPEQLKPSEVILYSVNNNHYNFLLLAGATLSLSLMIMSFILTSPFILPSTLVTCMSVLSLSTYNFFHKQDESNNTLISPIETFGQDPAMF